MMSDLIFTFYRLHNDLLILKKETSINFESKTHSIHNKSYIINFFILVEGFCYQLRKHLLNEDSLKLSKEDEILLKCSLRENNIEQCNWDKGFMNSFKASFKIFAKYYQIEELAVKHFSKNEFQNFKNAILIRNNLVHPKSPKTDLEINGEMAKQIDRAHEWFHSFTKNLLDKSVVKND